jgi:L-lactate dehydrogenase complex protein LldE
LAGLSRENSREKKPRPALFIPCLVDSFAPEVGEAVATVLRRLGLDPVYPDRQTCCGQPAFNSGYRARARTAARRFIEIFEAHEHVVCPSGSCVAMVRHHYPQLFEEDRHWADRAATVARHTFEFTEYLVDVLGVEDLGASFSGHITYHDSCHLLNALGVALQPRRLIGKVAGAEFREMPDSDHCCGFGGSFSVKYPDISAALLEDKVKNIVASGAQWVVGADMGCLLNIEGMLHRKGLPVKVIHIAQLLASRLSK